MSATHLRDRQPTGRLASNIERLHQRRQRASSSLRSTTEQLVRMIAPVPVIIVVCRAGVQFSPGLLLPRAFNQIMMRVGALHVTYPKSIFVAGVLWFTAEGTGQTPQNTSKIALIDSQPALWAQLTLLATTMKNGLGMPILRASLLPLLADCASSALVLGDGGIFQWATQLRGHIVSIPGSWPLNWLSNADVSLVCAGAALLSPAPKGAHKFSATGSGGPGWWPIDTTIHAHGRDLVISAVNPERFSVSGGKTFSDCRMHASLQPEPYATTHGACGVRSGV